MKSFIANFEKAGLVNLRDLDPSIISDLKYATTDNFTKERLYYCDFGLYLEPGLANAVASASRTLQRIKPEARLVVFDAARPLSVQKKMYEVVRGTGMEKYVADPYGNFNGGFHNYGMAVDLSISVDGELLDMGTDFDSFLPAAHSGEELKMLEDGTISFEAYKNRMLLYFITSSNGMLPHKYEWWHYQIEQNEQDKLKHTLLAF
ncbi:MAG: peptidase M15 [Muribaculaceae bacterium]|nr:peptidase M15 [Muribaculaceae bacterium]